ncbi:MAG: hypothetical protein ACI3Z9_05050, partial [Candidatus Onthomorpha sp.]
GRRQIRQRALQQCEALFFLLPLLSGEQRELVFMLLPMQGGTAVGCFTLRVALFCVGLCAVCPFRAVAAVFFS